MTKHCRSFQCLKVNSSKLFGPYCDNQYKSLLKQLDAYKETNLNYSELELEHESEVILKKMLIRHLKYSWLEVCRMTNRLYRRYRWELPTGTIELKKPLYIDGRFFSKWLNENIKDPDPTKKSEKYRIQKEIDYWFGHSGFIDFDSISNINLGENDFEDSERYPEDFSTLVAIEKSENLNKLRPSIRSLGKEKVNQFVSRILDNILYDENNNHIYC